LFTLDFDAVMSHFFSWRRHHNGDRGHDQRDCCNIESDLGG
jgi:hypothetical protein